MDANAMKRMIVLKNLQSNMIDEAYVVFKNNVKIRKYEKINNEKKEDKKYSKDYMVKEAELVVNEYISNLDNKKINFSQMKENYKRLKIFTISLTLFSILNFILFLLK